MSSRFVFDSSAVLAVINLEPGSDLAESKFEGAKISTVNVAEVFSRLAEKSINLLDAASYFGNLGIEVVDFDAEHAQRCAELRPLTKHLGLSLGDRACLALAIVENASAVTADKSWAKLDFCKIELIR